MFDELNAKSLFGAFGKLPGLSITKKRYELNEREQEAMKLLRGIDL
ncbi:hypothetical protein [Cohaesibacter sp. CAU 1516]|nr:hypothetical protein [Cohaesibacter sp. CAU 1516]